MSAQFPSRRRALAAVAATLILSAICWYLGAGVWTAIALGGIVVTIAIAIFVGTNVDVRELRWQAGDPARPRGSRNEVSTLAYRLRAGWVRVDGSIRSPMRRIARRRLALAGLDLDDPGDAERIEQLIGTHAYWLLTHDHRRPLSRHTVDRCLDALDAIDPLSYRSAPAIRTRKNS